MSAFRARIERLEPMRVASARAFGQSPEREAWRKLAAWAGPLGLLDDPKRYPVFGFNNPHPSPDRGEYGYEFWVAVGSEIEAGPGIEIKHFGGGLYAVATCRLLEEVRAEFFQREGFLESWQKLYDWVEASRFRQGSHQALEKHRNPGAPVEELVLDLYYPMEE